MTPKEGENIFEGNDDLKEKKSENKPTGIYIREIVPKEEVLRLKEMRDYPNRVSAELLGSNLDGKIVLDVGSGSQSELGKYVGEQGGTYIAFDISDQMLREIEKGLVGIGISFLGVLGDAERLPFGNGKVDIVHHRFVLMHLPENRQKESIKEALRVAKERVLLLEHNWNTLRSVNNREQIERLRELSLKFASHLKIDLNLGDRLSELVQEFAQDSTVIIQRFDREEGNYTPELISLLRSATEISKKIIRDEELARGFEELRTEFEHSPITFVPPEIVAAVIDKKK